MTIYRIILLFAVIGLTGCNPFEEQSADLPLTLNQAREKFNTNLVTQGQDAGPPDIPPEESDFELIRYDSEVGPLAAYITRDPGDGKKCPAIIWITGGDNNSIGDVWTPQSEYNDQSASPFREAGIVMMFPSQRGGNDNPGRREGFLGETNDILSAADYLKQLPYVDGNQLYLGGHSTGGTMVMLVAESTDKFKAVFSLGPVAAADQYGGRFIYCDIDDEDEILIRSPYYWLDDIKTPLYVFEGVEDGNWDSIQYMLDINSNPLVEFYRLEGHDHFSLIYPLAQLLAKQINSGKIEIEGAEL